MAKEKEKKPNKFANMMRKETDHKDVIKDLVHHDLKSSQFRFDYSTLEINDDAKDELRDIEKELTHHQKRFTDLSLDMAKALNNARDIFIKSHSESFMNWYESLGFNKNQVSALINKYKLVLEFPEKEENIISLTDKQILEVVNKKTPEALKERILNGEKISAAEIRRERQNISSREEIFSEIEEAEIVEKRVTSGANQVLRKIKGKVADLELFIIENDGLLESDVKELQEVLEKLNKVGLK